MHSIAFARFWQVDLTRECFLGHLDPVDLRSLRLVSQGFASTLAPVVFKEVTINFDATCFARQARMAALSRIGHHVKTLAFRMSHTDETFLPPLFDSETLQETTFQYDPQVSLSRSSSPGNSSSTSKYGSWQLNDLLVRQYPLLFHAATNISSFIRAMQTMPYLTHLQISCPDKHQSLRRDIVDYALSSLRIAVEQSNPVHLETLSLNPVRPSSLYYLRPQLSFGTSPASTRVWRRITTLNMVMDSQLHYDSESASGADRLKILHTYLANFSSLKHFSFTWTGHKGPSPLSLHTEPCITTPSPLDYLSCVATDSSSPPSLSSSPSSIRSSASSYFEPFAARRVAASSSLRPLKVWQLKSMRLCNAMLDASQAALFIHTHRKTLTEFQFESCHLRSGTWDDALSPLTKMSGSEAWKQKQEHHPSPNTQEQRGKSPLHRRPSLKTQPSLLPLETSKLDTFKNEVFEVPLILSPSDETEALQLAIRDRLWMPDDTMSAFRDDEYDIMSNASMGLSSRRRGVRALRRLGRKMGLSSLKEEMEGDVAMNGARRLLRVGGARHTW